MEERRLDPSELKVGQIVKWSGWKFYSSCKIVEINYNTNKLISDNVDFGYADRDMWNIVEEENDEYWILIEDISEVNPTSLSEDLID